MELSFDAAPPTSETNAMAESAALEATRRLMRAGHEVTVGVGAFEDGFRWIVRPSRLANGADDRELLHRLADELGGHLREAG